MMNLIYVYHAAFLVIISLVSFHSITVRLSVQKNVKSQKTVTNTLFDGNQRRKWGKVCSVLEDIK